MCRRPVLGGLTCFLVPFVFVLLVGIAPLPAQQPGAPAPSSAPATATAAGFHEELIAEIPAGSELKEWLSAGNRVAWVEKREKAWTVKLDSKPQGGAYDDVKYMSFNQDGTHLVFFCKRSGKWILVLDGQEGSTAYHSVTSVAFHSSGNSGAFCPCSEKKICHLVVDGKEVGPQYADMSFPRYSDDGKRLAYFAKRHKKWFAIVDGKETGPELDAVAFNDWGFSKHANRFFAAVWPPHSKWTYIVDDAPGPAFEVISPIAFSDDGKHYAYAGADAHAGFKKQKTAGTIVLDGQVGATYEGSGMSGFWTVLGGMSQSITLGPRDMDANFHGISNPAFNSDGMLVYAARRDKGDIAVLVGGQPGPGFDEILSGVLFSDESKHSSYIARRGSDFVEVHDKQPGKTFPIDAKMVACDWIESSPDGAHVAYELVRGGGMYKAGAASYNTTVAIGYAVNTYQPVPWLRARRSVVSDGQPGKEYNALGITPVDFTKDGRHYSYAVVGAEGKQYLIVVDGHESRLYDDAAYVAFSPDEKSVTFLARDGARLLRVTCPLQ